MMEVLFNFTVGGAGRESFQTHHIPKSVGTKIHSQPSVSIDSATEDSINHGS